MNLWKRLVLITIFGSTSTFATPPNQDPVLHSKECAFTLNRKTFNERLHQLNTAIHELPLSERNQWINEELDWFDDDFNTKTPLITNNPHFGTRLFQRSHRVIVTAFETGRRFDSRWVLINGHLYLEGFYRNQRYFLRNHLELPPPELALPSQPYFHFDETTNTYEYKRNNAHRELSRFLQNQFSKDGAVTLYRGLNKTQALFLKAIALLGQPRFSKTEFAKLRRSLKEEFESQEKYKTWETDLATLDQNLSLDTPSDRVYLQTKYLTFFTDKNRWQESLFSTPSLEKANGYADPYVMEATLPLSQLQELMNDRQLYIGVEWEDLELLFYGPDAVKLFASKATIRSTKPTKKNL